MKYLGKDFFRYIFSATILIGAGFTGAQACENKERIPAGLAEVSLKKSECHEYVVAVQTGDYLEITVQQNGVDVELELLEADQPVKTTDSENANSGYEFIALIAPHVVEYRLQIKWLDDGGTFVGNEGIYRIQIARRPSGADGRRIVAKLDEAAAVYTQGVHARRARQLSAAADFYLTAAAIYQSLPANRMVSYRAGIANYYRAVSLTGLGKLSESAEVLRGNVALAQTVHDEFLLGLTLAELGVVYQKSGEVGKSADSLVAAVGILEKLNARGIGEKATLPSTYLTLAETKLLLNRVEECVNILKKIRADFREPLAENQKATIKLADVYFNLGNREMARQLLEQMTLPESTDSFIKGHFNKVSGKLYIQNDRRRARDFFQTAAVNFAGNEREEAEIKMFTGHISYYEGDYVAAKTEYDSARADFERFGDRFNLAQTLNNLGVINYANHDYPAAASLCEDALSINLQIDNQLNQARNLLNLMYYEQALGNRSQAILYGKWAINLIQAIKYEQLRQLENDIQHNFLTSFADAFRQITDLLIKEGRLAEAEQILRFIKEKEYQDYTRGAGQISRVAFTKSEAERLEKIRKRFRPTGIRRSGEKNNNLTVPTQRDAGEMNPISPTLRLLHKLKRQGTPVSSIAFLTTMVTENSISIIFTTVDGQRVFTQPFSREQVSRSVFDLRSAVADPATDPRAAGQKVYELLVKPLEAELSRQRTAKIIWSLDGVLRYVPIPALYDGNTYLLSRFSNAQIALASDETILFPKIARPTATGLASSKPFENLSSLPTAKTEIDCIFNDGSRLVINSDCPSGLIKGNKFADEDFTRERFEEVLRRRQLVHFTSHFVLQPGDNTQSFLLLGGGRDRKYTLREFSNQRLDHVEMLTMSACDTANFSTDGAEFESFATMAQKQGAKAILGTLWSVADLSTTEFMKNFYFFYQIKNLDKAEAMRRAQLAVAGRKNFAHPYFWSAFVLYGNWK